MMDNLAERKFQEKSCDTCIYRNDIRDYCHIVRRIDGSYGCPNEKQNDIKAS